MAARRQPREHRVPVGGADARWRGSAAPAASRRPSSRSAMRLGARHRDAERGEVVLPHVVDRRGVAAGDGVGPRAGRTTSPSPSSVTGTLRRPPAASAARIASTFCGVSPSCRYGKRIQPQRPLARRQPGRQRRPGRRDIGQVGLGGQRGVARMRVRVAADLVALVEPALQDRLVVRRLDVAGDDERDRPDAVLLQHREQRLGGRPARRGVAARGGAGERQIVDRDQERPRRRRLGGGVWATGPRRSATTQAATKRQRRPRHARDAGARALMRAPSPTMASASISTSMSASISGAHLDHRRRRPDRPEHLAVGAADRLPVALDVHDVHPGADDVGQRRAGALEGALDVGQGLLRLRRRRRPCRPACRPRPSRWCRRRRRAGRRGRRANSRRSAPTGCRWRRAVGAWRMLPMMRQRGRATR